MAGLELKKVQKAFGDTKVIHSVDLHINDGEFVVFVGPSGCGKSTLLRMISGLEETTGGTIEIDGQDVTHVEPADRGVAMVFQSYALYPHMTVKENMGFGLKMTGHDKALIEDRVQKAAKILHLDQFLQRKPKALSGGQRQRVAIGRAIVREPGVFLFDEPLSNLDAELRVNMRLEIAKLHSDLGATMIYVTHDQVEAMTLANKIVVLRAGIIEQVGSPIELYDNPDNAFVAGFIGSPKMNFVKAEVTGSVDKSLELTVPGFADQSITVPVRGGSSIPQGSMVQLGVRPEHFVDTDMASFTAQSRVSVVEQLGGVSYLYALIDDGTTLTIERRGHASEREGDQVTIGIDPAKCFVFDDEGRRL